MPREPGRGPLQLDFAFTQRDTPELRARIHRDLDTVWRRETGARSTAMPRSSSSSAERRA